MVPDEGNNALADDITDAERVFDEGNRPSSRAVSTRAMLFPVVEKFVSINGEGRAQGCLASFIRFAGCNMWCAYCDTRWANHPLVEVEGWSLDALVEWVCETGVGCVTITGGEPLLEPYLPELAAALLAVEEPRPLRVEIETNGSRDVSALAAVRREARERGRSGKLCLTVDCKTPAAGSEVCAAMDFGNYQYLCTDDAVKFVVGSEGDIAYMRDIAERYHLWDVCEVLVSPVFGTIEPARIVECMKEMGLCRARLQLQMHKIIWPDAKRGV